MAPLDIDAIRADLERHGFAFTGVVFDEAVLAELRAECERAFRAFLTTLPAGTPDDDHRRFRPFLPRMFERSARVAAFARHPAFVKLASELIGPDADLTWSQACWKEPDPGDRTVFPYHQDGHFADVQNGGAGYACFIALGPLNEENGTLFFASGAHHARLPHHRNDRHQWFECSVEAYDVVPGTLVPGAMIVYRNLTPHGSPPNRTAAPREALLMSFGPPGTVLAASGEPFGDALPVLRGGVLVGVGQ